MKCAMRNTDVARGALVFRTFIAVAVAVACALFPLRSYAGCVPGTQVECACVNGTAGIQVCSDDGSRLLPCQCAAPQAVPPPQAAAALPAAPAAQATGGLRIEASAPGRVVVDGQDKGPAPVDLTGVTPGNHAIRVDFDNGTSQSDETAVWAGSVRRVVVEPSAWDVAGKARSGAHPGITAAAGVWLKGWTGTGPALGAGAFYNFGVSRAVDVRVGVNVMGAALGQRDFVDNASLGLLAGVPLSVRFNLGPVYTMMIGANVGYYRIEGRGGESVLGAPNSSGPAEYITGRWVRVDSPFVFSTYSGLFVGAEASIATFRFGSRRQYEFGLVQSLTVPVSRSTPSDAFNSSAIRTSQAKTVDDLAVFANNVVFSILLL
jgi:hypothetical protein